MGTKSSAGSITGKQQKQKSSLHFPLLCADVENCEEKWGKNIQISNRAVTEGYPE